MEGAEEAKRQREQLDLYLKWVEEEGGIDGPTRIDTMVQPAQVVRMEWLKAHSVGTILEVGCNWGIVLAWCQGQAGFDKNKANIELAQILAPKRRFYVGNARKLPIEDGAFDTVMLPDILEHILWEDVPKALKEARRVARQKVLITVPDADTAMGQIFRHAWLATPEKVKAIRDCFRRDNFIVERKQGFVLMEVSINV